MQKRILLVTLLSVTLPLAASALDASKEASAAQPSRALSDPIASGILKMGILVPGSRVGSELKGQEAIITVYGAPYAKSGPQLLRTDAVLIAKLAFEVHTKAARAKIRFGTASAGRPGKLRQITVTKGDVKAFGSGQITKNELMASLEVVDLEQAPALPLSRLSGASKGANAAPPPYDTLDTTGSADAGFTRYREGKTGLLVDYPSGWKVIEKPDKDTLFKVENGSDVEVSFQVSEGAGLTRETVARLFEELIFSQLKEFRRLPDTRTRIGRARNLDSLSRVIRFNMGGMNVKQRYFFFNNSTRVYSVVVTAPEASWSKVIPDVNRMLLTLAFTAGTGSGAASPLPPQVQAGSAKANSSWSQLTSFRTREGDLSIYYPSNWKLSSELGPDDLAKISGSNAEGMGAEITLGRLNYDPNVPLEEIVRTVEDRYLKSQKNYRKLKQQAHTIGSSGMQGIYQEVTFDHGGSQVRQLLFFHRGREHLYTVAMLGAGWKDSDMNFLFNKVLGTLRVND